MTDACVLEITSETRYMCHVYDRTFAEPHIGTFLGADRREALSAAYDAIIKNKTNFSDQQLADALDHWSRGSAYYELDEDGVSLHFATIRLNENRQ